MTVLVWFHRDLRLADHPALAAAVKSGEAVVPVYLFAPQEEAPWEPGGASRWYLHGSLVALSRELAAAGSRLVVRRGPTAEAIEALVRETGASTVAWNERPDPPARTRDGRVAARLSALGARVVTLPSALLHDPERLGTGDGRSYRVFTPFWRRFRESVEIGRPLARPRLAGRAPPRWPASLDVADLGLLPRVDWAGGLRERWTPGEREAEARLAAFVRGGARSYEERRDRPDADGTSRLSPALAHGELSPRRIWRALDGLGEAAEAFRRQLAWREFAAHVLHHRPELASEPMRPAFRAFGWRRDERLLRRWQRGATGYPIVDAGMRQLWRTGWMPNRVRMVVASFLTKHLLQPWQEGTRWFWDTLVDADLANNTLGWQWTAGCGPDAQPFFRIFNPVAQGERFDPDGTYVRRHLPELRRLGDRFLQRPWEAPALELAAAGVRLGTTYPEPMVDHREARRRALAELARLGGEGPPG